MAKVNSTCEGLPPSLSPSHLEDGMLQTQRRGLRPPQRFDVHELGHSMRLRLAQPSQYYSLTLDEWRLDSVRIAFRLTASQRLADCRKKQPACDCWPE